VFRRAVVWFSIGGEHYLTDPVTYEYMPDKVSILSLSVPYENLLNILNVEFYINFHEKPADKNV
jgi:hypothetical protein